MKKRVLVIDDEQMVLDAVQTILGEMGYDVTCFSDPIAGEQEALENDYDLILLDMSMPLRNGAEITRTVMREKRDSTILIITAHPGNPLSRKALDLGAKALVKKPFEIGKILEFLQR